MISSYITTCIFWTFNFIAYNAALPNPGRGLDFFKLLQKEQQSVEANEGNGK